MENIPKKINIAFAGAPCTGKTTTACQLFAALKVNGLDYDLITEESRKLRKEFGHFRSPFERFFMWKHQEREELRSTALNGFITDCPLFHFYIQARLYASEPRDKLAIRELFRMCVEIEDRYQLIVIAKNPQEFPFKDDQSRSCTLEIALKKHALVLSYVQHFLPEKLLLVEGTVDDRVKQVVEKLKTMTSEPIMDKEKKDNDRSI